MPTDMGVVINRNGGQIDNYMGDGLMALFGMENETGAALQAVKAGLEMIEATEHLKPYLEAIYTRSFQIGVGIHYGRGGGWRDRRSELEASDGNRRCG